MDRIQKFLLEIPSYSFSKQLQLTAMVVAVLLCAHALFALLTRKGRDISLRRGAVAVVIYLLFWLVTSVLAVTSFGSLWLGGKLEHWGLMVHTMAAGVFVVAMVAFAYAWNPVFGQPMDDSVVSEDDTTNHWWLARWSLWLVMLASFAVAGSMLLGMLPILDTQQMAWSIWIHRYAGLLVVVGLVLHLYGVAIQLLGWR